MFDRAAAKDKDLPELDSDDEAHICDKFLGHVSYVHLPSNTPCDDVLALSRLVSVLDFEDAYDRHNIDPVSLFLHYKYLRFFSKAEGGKGRLDARECWDIVCRIV